MSKKTVLASQQLNPLAMELLRDQVEVRVATNPKPSTLAREVVGAHAIVLRLGEVTAEVIAAADRLEVIGRNGVGLDAVDLAAATARGIAVVYTPDANSVSVAEHVVGAALALARNYPTVDREIKAGNWAIRERFNRELHGATFGFVGLGRIGSLAARMCRGAFDAEILAYDPYLEPEAATRAEATLVPSLEELLRRADVVSLHVALTPQTTGLIGARELEMMKPTAYLVNASRGPVVDERALVEALRSGTIAGAALDVFETEPISAAHPLCSLPNVVLTPHNAAQTREASERVTRTLMGDLLAVLSGRKPRYLANPEVWSSHQ